MIRWWPTRTTRLRPVVLAGVAWLVGAASAVAVGLLSLSIVGAGLFGPADPLAPAGDSDIPSTSAGPTAGPTPAGDQTLTSPGGTVVARCDERGAYLVLWSPTPGYQAEDIMRGPAPVARLKFETGGREITVSVRCVNGVPESTIDDENNHDR